MKQYVLGFLFDDVYHQVALIKKNRPEWQAGMLNGIGGKVEYNETPLEGMIREFREETTVNTKAKDWTYYLTLRYPDAIVDCYTCANSEYISKLKTNTDEVVGTYYTSVVFDVDTTLEMLDNVPALVELALLSLTTGVDK